jgi:FO synthase subunit 2
MAVEQQGLSAESPLSDWLALAAREPAGLPDEGYVALLDAAGDRLEELASLADRLARETVSDAITFVVNRNLDPAVVGGTDAVSRALLDSLVDEAWELGATEICMQGPLAPGSLPAAPLNLLAAIKARRPGLHLHAFRPAEVAAHARALRLAPAGFLAAARQAGLGSVPGTGARILDDAVRAALTAGSDISAASWTELIETAHRAGLRSTATMVYGHIETPAQQIAHLRALAAIQDRTGGFSELILMPIQPAQVPPSLLATGRVRYADARETRALHAVARLLLHGRVDHIQAAWPKLGPELTRQVLAGGADDLGGVLLDGRLAPDAGAEPGLTLSRAQVHELAAELGRPLRQRTTLYGEPSAERLAAWHRATAASQADGRDGSVEH